MKAVVISPDASVRLADLPEPELPDDGLIARTLGCGLCGTDLLKMNLGLLKAPAVLGHEWAGVVERVGPAVSAFKPGDLIVAAHHVPCGDCAYCRHGNESMCAAFKSSNFVPGGFAGRLALSGGHLARTTRKIPHGLPWREALLMEPLACCVRALDAVTLLPGDTAVVVGLGSIGLMMAALLEAKGVRAIGLDVDPARCARAMDHGAYASFPAPKADFSECLASLTEGRGADGVILTAGPSDILKRSLAWLRDGAFVSLFCHLSGADAPVDLAALYHRELRVVPSYSATPASLEKALGLLARRELKLGGLFTDYAPADFGAAVADVNQRRILKALIRFD